MALKNKTHDVERASMVQGTPQRSVPDANQHQHPLLSAAVAWQHAISPDSSGLKPGDVLALQRAIGNRAVQRMLAGKTQPRPGRLTIQPKLAVGPAGDHYEREADRVAAIVMQTPAPSPPQIQRQPSEEEDQEKAIQTKPLVSSITPLIQRQQTPEKEDEEETAVQRQSDGAQATVDSGVEQAIERVRGRGQALPDNLRARMERSFGADFSAVRVHNDAAADNLNCSLQARAFTTGPDLFFKRGEYDPSSRAGQELIAHELTHVVQQTNAHHAAGVQASKSRGSIQRWFTIKNPTKNKPDLKMTTAADIKTPADHKPTQGARAILERWADLKDPKPFGTFDNWQAAINLAEGQFEHEKEQQQKQQQSQQQQSQQQQSQQQQSQQQQSQQQQSQQQQSQQQPQNQQQQQQQQSQPQSQKPQAGAKVSKAGPSPKDSFNFGSTQIHPQEAYKNHESGKTPYGTYPAANGVRDYLTSLAKDTDTSFTQYRIHHADTGQGRLFVGNGGTVFWCKNITHVHFNDMKTQIIFWFDPAKGWTRIQG